MVRDRHRGRGADPRGLADQAAPAALQHPPARRQDLPLPAALGAGGVPGADGRAAPGAGRGALLRPVHPGRGDARHACGCCAGSSRCASAGRLRPGPPLPQPPDGPLPRARAPGRSPRSATRELVRGVALFLQGRGAELAAELRREMAAAAARAALRGGGGAARPRRGDRGDARAPARARPGGRRPRRRRAGAPRRARRRLAAARARGPPDRHRGVLAARPAGGRGGEDAALAGFLRDCYAGGREVPPEVVLPAEPAGRRAAARSGSARRRGAARAAHRPARRRASRALLAMAGRNAHAPAPGGEGRRGRRRDALLEELGPPRRRRARGCARWPAWMSRTSRAPTPWPRSSGGRAARCAASATGASASGAAAGPTTSRCSPRRWAGSPRGWRSGSWTGPDVVLLDGGRGQLAAGEAALAGAAVAAAAAARDRQARTSAGDRRGLRRGRGRAAAAAGRGTRCCCCSSACGTRRTASPWPITGSLRSKRLLAGPLDGHPGPRPGAPGAPAGGLRRAGRGAGRRRGRSSSASCRRGSRRRSTRRCTPRSPGRTRRAQDAASGAAWSRRHRVRSARAAGASGSGDEEGAAVPGGALRPRPARRGAGRSP